jgi:hypothetical protein
VYLPAIAVSQAILVEWEVKNCPAAKILRPAVQV